MRYQIFLYLFLISTHASAQIAIGLKESALGGSGVAITESSAPSYYNPALLAERQKSYFSLTGTTLTSFKSSTGTQEFNSTKFAPNYLSSINAFGSFVHEFALTNKISIDSRSNTPIANGNSSTNIKADQYSLSYAFAFKEFPFGFQIGLHVTEQNTIYNQNTNDGNQANGVFIDYAQRNASLFAAFGGIHQLGTHYRFGYKYESPSLKIYKKTTQDGSYYSYNQTGNTFTTGKPTFTNTNENFNSQTIALGHSFVAGDHEFLTDSRFIEDLVDKNTYKLYQSFGYKINFANQMQYMCGFSHQIGSGSPKISESGTFSTGFSWTKNTLRSTISAYFAQGESNSESSGITFGSEFMY